MVKRLLAGLVLVLIVGLGGFAAFAWRPTIAPIEPPTAQRFAPELVAQGEALAAAGNCASCHTIKGGQPFAGGLGVETPFGTIFTTNITPDVTTGIGNWSEAAFSRALHDGVSRDGSHLYPAFPYDHFTHVSDADTAALYAYFMTRKPVTAANRANTLPFPLNIRALQAGWKLLYFHAGKLAERADRSAIWNRGAYLAEGLAHCGSCHSPRNDLGAEVAARAYTGGVIDGRPVPALTRANRAPVPWSVAELYVYLRSGASLYHGRAGGPMRGIVRDGLAKLPDPDIQALAVYFGDIGETEARKAEIDVALKRAAAADALDLAHRAEPGPALYLAACASCHYDGTTTNARRPNLAFVTLINEPDPSGLIRIILRGAGAEMPAFAAGFSNADVAAIAAWLRHSRTGSAPWPDLDASVAAVRTTLAAAPTPTTPAGANRP